MQSVSENNSLKLAFSQLLTAIDLCIAARLRPPALILLYSGIDIAAALDSAKPSVRERFIDWVDKYLLPGSSLKCTADDLYGARCGLVHTYSPVSDLSKTGKVNTISYAWKPSTEAQLQKLVNAGAELSRRVNAPIETFIPVQGEGLIESFRSGIAVFLADLENDPARANVAHAKVGHFFSDLSAERAEDMLKTAEEVLGIKF
jgi:hypothetical protein